MLLKVSTYVYYRLVGRTLPGHVLLVALSKRLTSQRIITLLIQSGMKQLEVEWRGFLPRYSGKAGQTRLMFERV